MRRILLLLLLLPALLCAESIFPYPYKETVLDNGLRVILVPLDNAGLISFYTVVQAGSRDEVEPGKTGFAHFFEHLVFKGTEKVPADKYVEMLTRFGADFNAFTWDDYTTYYLHFPSQYLEQIIELEADRFQNLKYSVPEFQTEAKAILGEYNKNFANPGFQLEERLREIAFEKSTYEHTAMGFLKDIEDMPNQYEYSRTFYNRFYRPEYTTIVVAGKFDQGEVLSHIKKYYSEWKRGDYRTANPEEPEQQKEKRGQVNYPGDTLPMLAIAYKTPEFDPKNKDFAAVDLLSRLAFGETSEIYNRLVLQEQKLDSLNVEYQPMRDPYLFIIYAVLKDAKDLPYVEKTIGETFAKMKTEPVSAERLNDLKSNLKYGFLMSFDTSGSIAAGLGRASAPYIAMTTGVERVDQLFQTYASIRPEDIQRVAGKYFEMNNRTVVTLTGGKQ